MMRRVAMVLVCLVVGLGIYGGMYFWLRSIDGGSWIGADPWDPFADPREPLVTLFKPAVWLERELRIERPFRRELIAGLEGEWVSEGEGEFVTIANDWNCSFRLGGFEGSGTLVAESGRDAAVLIFEDSAGVSELSLGFFYSDEEGKLATITRLGRDRVTRDYLHPIWFKMWRKVGDRGFERVVIADVFESWGWGLM